MEQTPIICDVCLGNDDSVLNIKQVPDGIQCKICTLPCTLYYFKQHSNLKKSLICHRCASQRNACQICMLDMNWHISLSMRDKLVSLISENNDIVTPEMTNVMMKRYLSLKNGKLGGAKFTSDDKLLSEMMQNIDGTIEKLEKDIVKEQQKSGTLKHDDNGNDQDIKKILKRLPLTQSLDNVEGIRSFFLYGIDSSIPEWKIKDAISNVINQKQWCDDETSNGMVINHKAMSGGIKFIDTTLAEKFVKSLMKNNNVRDVPGKDGHNIKKGLLQVDQFKIYILPWKQGFSSSSFGSNKNESIKLAKFLQKLMISDMSRDSDTSRSTDVNTTKNRKQKNNDKKIIKPKKTKNKSKRVSSLQL